MSPSIRSRMWVWFVLGGVALVLVCVAALDYQRQRASWQAAIREQANCRDLVTRIQRLAALPEFAVFTAESAQAISNRIDQIARDTLPPGSLVGVEPEPERRHRDSPFSIRNTLIQIEEVTLEELASFAAKLEDPDQALVVSELRLLEVRAVAAEPERWTGDLKLTQTVYSANVPRQHQR